MMNLGKLEEIRDLRTVWPHEALDFTPWLAEDEHMTILGDAIGMEILSQQRLALGGKSLLKISLKIPTMTTLVN